jgi:hypothetical protein
MDDGTAPHGTLNGRPRLIEEVCLLAVCYKAECL